MTIQPEHHESYGKVVVALVVAVSISSYKTCFACNTEIQVVDHNIAPIKLTTIGIWLLNSSMTAKLSPVRRIGDNDFLRINSR